jgi:hypothetical protein
MHSSSFLWAGHVGYAGESENSLCILIEESEMMHTALETWALNKGQYWNGSKENTE